MNQELQWSPESYRLDKVTDIFGVPCVVRLEEGYLPPDEAEEFAQGDIITLDTEIPSDKVGAYFIQLETKEDVKPHAPKSPDYGVLTTDNQEVFLPYSYDGKLRVLKKIAKVHTVQELAEIFPGYAELEGKLSIKTNKGDSVTISKGTTIELDRIIPGSTFGSVKEPDKLVIKFEHSKEEKVAAIPFNMKGKFLTKVDHKKYTIKDAIERYGVPLEVQFVTDELKRKFYQEVLAGRRKLKSVTATLRLNRIVKQRVIVGHYKPIVELDNGEDTGEKGDKKTDNVEEGGGDKDVRTRTVVVIPVDNPEIGEIPVNVCEGDVLTIYESLVNIKSVTEARDMVKESLCLDFEVKPGMKLIANIENEKKYENVKHGQRKAPPLPARPNHPLPVKTAFERENAQNPPQRKPPIRDDGPEQDDDYLEPVTPNLRKGLEGYIDMSGTHFDASSSDRPCVPPRLPSHVPLPTKKHDAGKKEKGKEKEKKHFWKKSTKKAKATENKPRPPMPDPPLQNIPEDDGLDGYEEINKLVRFDQRLPVSSPPDLGEYKEINRLPPTTIMTEDTNNRRKSDNSLRGYDEIEDVIALHKGPQTHTESTHKDEVPVTPETSTSANVSSDTYSDSELTRNVERQTNASLLVDDKTKNSNKLFKDLTNDELVDRLILCNLHEIAETCKEEKLDGEYFIDETPESLKDTYGLKGIKLAKFLKMRDENWVSK